MKFESQNKSLTLMVGRGKYITFQDGICETDDKDEIRILMKTKDVQVIEETQPKTKDVKPKAKKPAKSKIEKNDPFIRIIPKSGRERKDKVRLPVCFASLKQTENLRLSDIKEKLFAIKKCKSLEDLRTLTTPDWMNKQQTKIKRQTVDIDKPKTIRTFEDFTSEPIDIMTLHRINLIVDINKRLNMNYDEKSAILESQVIMGKCPSIVADYLCKNIDNPDDEVHYIFQLADFREPKKHLAMLINPKVIQFYEHLRSSIINNDTRMYYPNGSNALQVIGMIEKQIFGNTSHQTPFAISDYNQVIRYIQSALNAHPERLVRVCDVCGMLHFSRTSKRTSDELYVCAVHTQDSERKKIKRLRQKYTNQSN